MLLHAGYAFTRERERERRVATDPFQRNAIVVSRVTSPANLLSVIRDRLIPATFNYEQWDGEMCRIEKHCNRVTVSRMFGTIRSDITKRCLAITYDVYPRWDRAVRISVKIRAHIESALFRDALFFNTIRIWRCDRWAERTGRSVRHATEQSVINAEREIAHALSRPHVFSFFFFRQTENAYARYGNTHINTHTRVTYTHTRVTWIHAGYGIQNERMSTHFRWRSNETPQLAFWLIVRSSYLVTPAEIILHRDKKGKQTHGKIATGLIKLIVAARAKVVHLQK